VRPALRHGVVALLSLPLVLGLALASCAQVLGADDYATTTCADPLAVFDAQHSGCADCMRSSCGAEETACAQNAACAQALCCYAGCDYSSCRIDCTPADDDAGRAAYVDLFQCRTSCVEACAMGQHWGCVGHVAFPSKLGTVVERLGIIDLVSMTPLSGISAKACSDLDYPCGTALATGTSDDAGLVELAVPRDSRGFVWLDDPSGAYLQTIYIASDPVVRTSAPGVFSTVPLISPMVVDFASSQTGISLKPDTAQIAYLVYDCIGDSAPGVAATLTVQGDPVGEPFFLHNDVPTTSPAMTDTSGLGAILNAPGGTSAPVLGAPVLGELQVRLVSTQELLAKQLVVLYAGKFTLARLGPTPL
jgi:hypothetical protein